MFHNSLSFQIQSDNALLTAEHVRTTTANSNDSVHVGGSVDFDGVENADKVNDAAEQPTSVPSYSVEVHTFVAALFLVVSVVCDALTALETPPDQAEAPSSLRTSSLVAVAMFGAPVIGKRSLVDQRIVLGTVLVLLAALGLHQGDEETRTGDVVYTGIALLMFVQVYASGGVEAETVRPDSVHNTPHRRQTVVGLCAALMLYCAARGVRLALNARRPKAEAPLRVLRVRDAILSFDFCVLAYLVEDPLRVLRARDAYEPSSAFSCSSRPRRLDAGGRWTIVTSIVGAGRLRTCSTWSATVRGAQSKATLSPLAFSAVFQVQCALMTTGAFAKQT